MSNISSMSNIESGTQDSNRCYASVVSNNFSQIETAINSNALNSDNYGESQVRSNHISESQLQSYHISDGAVVREKLQASVAIQESHINWASSANGVKLLRISTNIPAGGIEVARYSTTGVQSSGSSGTIRSMTWQLAFSDAIDGAPSFSEAPTFIAQPIIQYASSDISTDIRLGAKKANGGGSYLPYVGVNLLGSDSCVVEFRFSAGNYSQDSHNVSVYAAVIGAKSG